MADQFDELAYRFWSIHPKDIPEPVGMPEGYKGGKRAWFYANEMRAALPAQGVREMEREILRLKARLWSIGHAAGSETKRDLQDDALAALRGGAK